MTLDLPVGLSPAETALQARARDFSLRVVRPRAAAIDRDEQYPADIVQALAEAGFLGMTMPKALGGKGASFLDAVLVIEEMAKSCTVTSRIVVETNMGAISTVMAYGSLVQKELAARLVLEGDKPAICITEPNAGSDAMAMTTRADRRGDVFVINGKKHWITGAGVSRLHLIFARVFDERGEEMGVGGFLAVRDDKALRLTKREKTMGLRGMPEGELTFDNLEVPADMIPEELIADLAGLDVGDSIRAADLKLPKGATLAPHDRDATVASIGMSSAMGQGADGAEGDAAAAG